MEGNTGNTGNTGNNLLTGVRDLDREILNKLSEKDLLNMCVLNKTYSEKVCDETYFRLRTLARFPETVPYKDYTHTKNWKNHYFTNVKYIELLKSKFQYIYKRKDKSPELLYLARLLTPKFSYSKNLALIRGSFYGKLEIIKYLFEDGANIDSNESEALRWASSTGYLETVKYLVENGADIQALDNQALRWASKYGYLSIVEYLVEHGADIQALDNQALRWASENGYLNIVEYLQSFL